MSSIEKVIAHAEQHCKARGARLTPKRKQVLSGLLSSDKALSAYELIDVCKDEFAETIPAMSMYRILEFLESERLVHRLNLANKYVACSHITCEHRHDIPQFLICRQCDKVKEITVSRDTIQALKQDITQAGFTLMSPQLEMDCLCDNCSAASA